MELNGVYIQLGILVFALGIKFLEKGKNQKNGFSIKLLISPGIITSINGLIVFFGKLEIPSLVSGASLHDFYIIEGYTESTA